MLVSAGSDLKFHSWPEDSTVPIIYRPSPSTRVVSLSFSKDCSFLSLLSENARPEIVSVRDLGVIRNVHTIAAFDDVTSVAFGRTTKRIIGVATRSGRVALYDTQSKSIGKVLPEVASCATSVGFNVSDKNLAVACSNGNILVYSMTDENVPCTLASPHGSVQPTSMTFHPTEDNTIGVGMEDGTVAFWDIGSCQKTFSSQTHTAEVTGLAYSQASNLLLTAASDNKFCMHDLVIQECIFRSNLQVPLTAADFNQDGVTFALGTQDGRIYVYDVRQYVQPLSTFKAHTCAVGKVVFGKQFSQKLLEQPSDISLEACQSSTSSRSQEIIRKIDVRYAPKVQEESCDKSLAKEVIESMTRGAEELQNQLMESFENLQNLISEEFRNIDLQMEDRWDVLKTVSDEEGVVEDM